MTEKKDFDREQYRRQLQSNNLIGILLGLSALAMAIILYIISRALS